MKMENLNINSKEMSGCISGVHSKITVAGNVVPYYSYCTGTYTEVTVLLL